jgi:hypothetical protein
MEGAGDDRVETGSTADGWGLMLDRIGPGDRRVADTLEEYGGAVLHDQEPAVNSNIMSSLAMIETDGIFMVGDDMENSLRGWRYTVARITCRVHQQ